MVVTGRNSVGVVVGMGVLGLMKGEDVFYELPWALAHERDHKEQGQPGDSQQAQGAVAVSGVPFERKGGDGRKEPVDCVAEQDRQGRDCGTECKGHLFAGELGQNPKGDDVCSGTGQQEGEGCAR